MSKRVSDEPPLFGQASDSSEPVTDEPALFGIASREPADPLAALGNEPALGLNRDLPNYEQVYRQFRSEGPVSWWTALGVTAANALTGVLIMMLPIGLMLARLFGATRISVSFPWTAYIPALVGVFLVIPALVWVEIRPWTVPNAGVLAAATGGPGLGVGLWLASLGVLNGSMGVVVVAFLALVIPAALSALGVIQVWNAVDLRGEVPDPTLVIPYSVAAGIVAMIGVLVSSTV